MSLPLPCILMLLALAECQLIENVVVPAAAGEVDVELCLSDQLYDSVEAIERVVEEDDYLCAFLAFQANKEDGVGVGVYESVNEASERYDLFVVCVQEVWGINSGSNSWVAEVNFFCDMTDEEKMPYADSDAFGVGSGTGDQADYDDYDLYYSDDSPSFLLSATLLVIAALFW